MMKLKQPQYRQRSPNKFTIYLLLVYFKSICYRVSKFSSRVQNEFMSNATFVLLYRILVFSF
jgi:hypothetical protein